MCDRFPLPYLWWRRRDEQTNYKFEKHKRTGNLWEKTQITCKNHSANAKATTQSHHIATAVSNEIYWWRTIIAYTCRKGQFFEKLVKCCLLANISVITMWLSQLTNIVQFLHIFLNFLLHIYCCSLPMKCFVFGLWLLHFCFLWEFFLIANTKILNLGLCVKPLHRSQTRHTTWR